MCYTETGDFSKVPEYVCCFVREQKLKQKGLKIIMKIKQDVVLRCVAGEYMLVPIGGAVLDFNGLFIMTESGKLLWSLIENGAEKEELVSALMKEYEVDSKTATEDVCDFIKKLIDFGIVE